MSCRVSASERPISCNGADASLRVPMSPTGSGRSGAWGRRAIVSNQVPPYSALIPCLLYTSDAADEEDSVDLGGRRIIKKKKIQKLRSCHTITEQKNRMNVTE
eukprot:TRINITY_DN3185_c0_g1_i1.p3 TRINITY_DN3185_c0_g1~~TRINITY_DN3185_c0_g1_i1.p3  ORF type:complete len:103 (+),score=7.07 TRINITY_DN3185_c0_g1_i1:786-1094(+)